MRISSGITRATILVLLLAVIGAGCDADGATDPAAGQQPMELSLTVRPVEQVDPPPAGCQALFRTAIEGTATQLGTVEGRGSTCIVSQVAPDPSPPFLPTGPGPYMTLSFTNPLWVLTAENGDELWIETVEAVAVISGADNSLRASGTQRIIGGTGRFANAAGELEAEGENADGQGPDDFSARGWIEF